MSDDIEIYLQEEAAREQRLNELLAASPLCTISGVIAALGATGAQSMRQVDWTLIVPLAAWREEGQPVRRAPLTLRQGVDENRLESLRRHLLPYRVVRVRARVALNSEFDIPRAQIEEFLGSDPEDSELTHIASELQRTVTLEDDFFGQLVLDRSVGWFQGTARWNGTLIKIYLSVDDSVACDTSLKVARALWSDQASCERRAKDMAVEELLQIKNDHWLDEGQAPITAEQFRSLLTIESVTTSPDGTFEFWCEDGDMFAGHAISVFGNLEKGPLRATLEG